MKRQVTDTLSAHFRPEFLNRVDEVIVFHALTDADLERIVGLLLADLGQAAGEPGSRPGPDPGRSCADRSRGHGPSLRGEAAQANNPAAGGEPIGAGAGVRPVQAGRPGNRRRRSRFGHGRVLDRGATLVTEGGTRRDARRRGGDEPGTTVRRRVRPGIGRAGPAANDRAQARRRRAGRLVGRGSTEPVRLDTVVARLEALPADLPPPADALMPMFGGGTGAFPRVGPVRSDRIPDGRRPGPALPR